VILLGNYPPPFSGQSVAFKTLVDGFEKSGREFDVINTIEKLDRRTLLHRSFDYSFVMVKLLFCLSTRKNNIVYHIVSSSKSGFIRDYCIINLAKLFNARLVLHSHNGNYDDFFNSCSLTWQKIIKRTLNKASKIVLLSSSLNQTFYFLNAKNRFVYVPNGIPIEVPVDLVKEDSTIDVLYLSNLIESKGYLDLLEAIIILKRMQRHCKFHFHFAGSFMLNPSQDVSYKTLHEAEDLFLGRIRDNDLDEFVTYHGVVKGESKTELLSKANIFVLPTYYNVEAQPITIIEAMAYGCAILATEYRGIPEMLIDKYNGLFINARDPSDIAERLSRMTNNSLKKYSLRSREKFKERFTMDRHVKSMLDLFDELNKQSK